MDRRTIINQIGSFLGKRGIFSFFFFSFALVKKREGLREREKEREIIHVHRIVPGLRTTSSVLYCYTSYFTVVVVFVVVVVVGGNAPGQVRSREYYYNIRTRCASNARTFTGSNHPLVREREYASRTYRRRVFSPRRFQPVNNNWRCVRRRRYFQTVCARTGTFVVAEAATFSSRLSRFIFIFLSAFPLLETTKHTSVSNGISIAYFFLFDSTMSSSKSVGFRRFRWVPSCIRFHRKIVLRSRYYVLFRYF